MSTGRSPLRGVLWTLLADVERYNHLLGAGLKRRHMSLATWKTVKWLTYLVGVATIMTADVDPFLQVVAVAVILGTPELAEFFLVESELGRRTRETEEDTDE